MQYNCSDSAVKLGTRRAEANEVKSDTAIPLRGRECTIVVQGVHPTECISKPRGARTEGSRRVPRTRGDNQIASTEHVIRRVVPHAEPLTSNSACQPGLLRSRAHRLDIPCLFHSMGDCPPSCTIACIVIAACSRPLPV